MQHKRKKQQEKFEEKTNMVRLQLIYADMVNEKGHELSKLYHQAEISRGPKQARKEDAMMRCAERHGFWFYTSLDDQRIMRMRRYAMNEGDD